MPGLQEEYALGAIPEGAVGSPGEPTGIIFNIQHHSIHDGPGIRSVVFMKGCPMRCLWCSNPESQSFHIETEVNLRTGLKSTIGTERNVGEVVREILRDRPYYRKSGGGMTLSGGEALAQIRFAKALLAECHRQNIATAVETAGGVPWEHFQYVIPFVDLFLFDLKHMDDGAHRRMVGISNVLVLENLRRLSGSVARIWIRIPLVPTVNCQIENLEASAAFIASLPRPAESVHLLPFHHYGFAKYLKLGRENPLEGVEALAGKESDPEGPVELARHLLESKGLPVQIGG